MSVDWKKSEGYTWAREEGAGMGVRTGGGGDKKRGVIMDERNFQ